MSPTNLYASALATAAASSSSTTTSRRRMNRLGNEELPGESVVRTAAKTSLYAGILLMLLLLAVARPLIALYVGPEACSASPGLLDAAYDYVIIGKVRAQASTVGQYCSADIANPENVGLVLNTIK
jgi:hypothetical protein